MSIEAPIPALTRALSEIKLKLERLEADADANRRESARLSNLRDAYDKALSELKGGRR